MILLLVAHSVLALKQAIWASQLTSVVEKQAVAHNCDG
jgi:hypothetical protein